MRLIRSILLGIIALFFIAAVIIQMRDGSLERLLGRDSFKEGDQLFSYNPNKAELIMVNFDGKSYSFRKNDKGVWWSENPWNDRMDPRAAEAIIQFSLTTRIVDVVPEEEAAEGGLREFGVENSPVNIVIKGSSSLARFRLGNVSPWVIPPKDPEKEEAIPTIYLKSDHYQWGKDIFVVTGNIAPLFKDGLRFLRDHCPLNLNAEALNKLSRIEVKSKDAPFSLTKELEAPELSDDETKETVEKPSRFKWVMTTPAPFETDPQMVNNLIGVLQRLTATQVDNADEITILQKDSPLKKEITLHFDDSLAPVTLTLYPPEKENSKTILATVSDRSSVFTLPIDKIDPSIPCVKNIILEPKLLRSRKLVSIDRRDLTAISLRSRDAMTPILIKKNEANRWVCSPDGTEPTPVHEQQLYNLLKTLELDKVYDFATDSAVDLAPYGLDDPRYTLTFGFGASEPTMIFISRGVDEKYYAMVNDEPHVYELSSAYVDQLGLQPHKWKTLELIHFNSSELKSILLEQPNKPNLTIHYDFAQESWNAFEGDKDISSQINPHKANNYLYNLEKTKILQWLDENNKLAHEALRNPTHKLTLVIEPTISVPGYPTETETLIFAPMSKDNNRIYYGQKIGDNNYFILEGEILDTLYTNLKETIDDDR